MSTVTPLEHTGIGAMGGVFEVCLLQPMVGIKNALQEGRPVPKNPLHLYRGLAMNIASMAPITASQFGTYNLMQNMFTSGSAIKELSSTQKFASAAVAGAASAFIATPSEMIIIHQQKTGHSLSNQASLFVNQYGYAALRRGLLPCMGREALYAAGYLGMFPVLNEMLQRSPIGKDLGLNTCTVIAGVAGGVFGAFFSHPFDTTKTRMQAFMYEPKYLRIRDTVRTIYEEGGVTQFWKGLLPRMTRIIIATFVLNAVRTNTVQYIDDVRGAAAKAAIQPAVQVGAQ